MSTVGALFVVFLGMSPKEEQMLQRLFKCRGLPLDVTERGANAAEIILDPPPQIIHLPLAPRRRHVTWADCRKYMVTIGCSACSELLFVERHRNFVQKSVEQGLASKWSTILKVTSVSKFANADDMWNLRLKWTGHPAVARGTDGDPALV